jgi:hypothetical protein
MKKHFLPNRLRPFFWDYDFNTLTWEKDRDLVIKRILTSGDWNAIDWLRSHAGDESLREWIQQHQGNGLSPRQLRFWELILEIPRRQVNIWLSTERRNVWEKRIIQKILLKGPEPRSKKSAQEHRTNNETVAFLYGGRNCHRSLFRSPSFH